MHMERRCLFPEARPFEHLNDTELHQRLREAEQHVDIMKRRLEMLYDMIKENDRIKTRRTLLLFEKMCIQVNDAKRARRARDEMNISVSAGIAANNPLRFPDEVAGGTCTAVMRADCKHGPDCQSGPLMSYHGGHIELE